MCRAKHSIEPFNSRVQDYVHTGAWPSREMVRTCCAGAPWTFLRSESILPLPACAEALSTHSCAGVSGVQTSQLGSSGSQIETEAW